MKPIETSFKRIETKYVVAKADLANLIEDLKIYLVEDDYPTSTISNIYFDTEQFDMIQEDDQGTKRKEKIRMRTYLSQVQPYSQVFLEIKSKDRTGVGRKYRLLSTPQSITQFMTKEQLDNSIRDQMMIEKIQQLQEEYQQAIIPRMYTYYDRFSLKEKKEISGFPYNKIRITIDQNLTYRDDNVSLFSGKDGFPLLNEEIVIMEIKAPGRKPQWLQNILDQYGLVEQKFSKYSCAYHKSQGLDYSPRPSTESVGTTYV